MTGPLHGFRAEQALPGHPVWGEIAPEFHAREFHCPNEMDVSFLRLLSRTRRRAGVPFRIISDYRSPERNEEAGGATKSAHMERPCRAVDLHVKNNYERFQVVQAAMLEGFVRVGVYPAHEGGSGSVHLDASEVNPAPRCWTRW